MVGCIYVGLVFILVLILKFVPLFMQCNTPAAGRAAAQVGHKAWKSHHKQHIRVVQSGKNSQIHELGFPMNGSSF